jgi:hypothetical protein
VLTTPLHPKQNIKTKEDVCFKQTVCTISLEAQTNVSMFAEFCCKTQSGIGRPNFADIQLLLYHIETAG